MFPIRGGVQMARHDDEHQPQSPDLGASVQLESGESLEDTLDSDPLDAGYVPPDRPYLLDEDGVTGAGMRDGDTLDQRLRREQDAEPVDPDRAGRLVIADEGAALETPDALDGVDVGIDGGAAAAEEAAVHEISDAAVGTGGPPLETEPSVADAPELADPEVDAALVAEGDVERAGRDARADMAPEGGGSGPEPTR
jgi:hypothetical protein